jgi:hypothetical protein
VHKWNCFQVFVVKTFLMKFSKDVSPKHFVKIFWQHNWSRYFAKTIHQGILSRHFGKWFCQKHFIKTQQCNIIWLY